MMTGVLDVDVTGMVRKYLADTLTVRMVTELPADLETVLPLGRVVRTGGPDDGITLDYPTLVTHWFAATDSGARALAIAGCTAYRALRGVTIGNALTVYVRKLAGPTWVDYENPNVRRHITTHELRVTTV